MDNVGKLSDKIRELLARQVRERGIVVWYDPEKAYHSLVKRLELPETAILTFDDSFFRLREQLEPFLDFVSEDGRLKPEADVPPKVIIYVPLTRGQSEFALIEAETAGTVVEPGADAAERNTRLRAIVEHVFSEVAPEKATHVARQAEEGLLTLEELDQIAEEAGSVATGALKLVFGQASPMDILLAFASGGAFDQKLEEKRALGEVAALVQEELGLERLKTKSPVDLRAALQQHLLLGDLALALPDACRTGPLAGVTLPTKAVQRDTLRHLCNIWRNRVDLQQAYRDAAERIEQQVGIAQLHLPAAPLRDVETFPCIEHRLLREAESALLAGKADDTRDLANRRRESFWSRQSPEILLRWSLIETAAELVRIGASIRSALIKRKWNITELINAYTSGSEPWMLLDRWARHLESRYARCEVSASGSDATLETVMTHARREYTKTLEELAEAYTAALERDGFQPEGLLHQTQVFHERVSPQLQGEAKTAYFLVDALRYEMAAELIGGLHDDFDVRLEPALGQLPSITQIGMAALLPGAQDGLSLEAEGNRMRVCVQGHALNDRAARLTWLQERAGVPVATCRLGDVAKLTAKRKKELLDAQLIVVTSREIDRHGEEGSEEEEARIYMDEILEKLRRSLRNLAKIGVREFVIAADHGFIFLEGLDASLKMNPPGGQTVELHHRVWIGRGGIGAQGYFRINASDVELGGPLELAFPRGLGLFKLKPYFHGGASLQEQLIPVCRLTARKRQMVAPVRVTLSLAKPKITNRFFPLTVRVEADGLFADVQKRIRIEVLRGKDDVGVAAMAAYGFEEGTREILFSANKPNSVTLMLTVPGKLDKIDLRAVDCETQLPLATLEDVPVDLAI